MARKNSCDHHGKLSGLWMLEERGIKKLDAPTIKFLGAIMSSGTFEGSGREEVSEVRV